MFSSLQSLMTADRINMLFTGPEQITGWDRSFTFHQHLTTLGHQESTYTAVFTLHSRASAYI